MSKSTDFPNGCAYHENYRRCGKPAVAVLKRRHFARQWEEPMCERHAQTMWHPLDLAEAIVPLDEPTDVGKTSELPRNQPGSLGETASTDTTERRVGAVATVQGRTLEDGELPHPLEPGVSSSVSADETSLTDHAERTEPEFVCPCGDYFHVPQDFYEHVHMVHDVAGHETSADDHGCSWHWAGVPHDTHRTLNDRTCPGIANEKGLPIRRCDLIRYHEPHEYKEKARTFACPGDDHPRWATDGNSAGGAL